MYRPLPEEVTIKQSKIHGLGLFAEQNIPEGKELGISHINDVRFENDYIRTPLGGFINHSETPNCDFVLEGDFIHLITLKDISSGEELVTRYWGDWYKW